MDQIFQFFYRAGQGVILLVIFIVVLFLLTKIPGFFKKK